MGKWSPLPTACFCHAEALDSHILPSTLTGLPCPEGDLQSRNLVVCHDGVRVLGLEWAGDMVSRDQLSL